MSPRVASCAIATDSEQQDFMRRAGEMFQMISTTSEFQFG